MGLLLAQALSGVEVALALALAALVAALVAVLAVLSVLSQGKLWWHTQRPKSCSSTAVSHLTTTTSNWQLPGCNQMAGSL